jgi:ribonuclease HI
MHIHISFDGGSRGNPGVAGAGAVVTLTEKTAANAARSVAAAAATTATGSSNGTDETEAFRKVVHVRDYLGLLFTNNQAEYQGVVSALRVALHEVQQYVTQHEKRGTTATAASTGMETEQKLQKVHLQVELVVQGDSHLILQQLCGVWECRNNKLKAYHETAVQYLQQMGRWGECQRSLQHMYRYNNKAADGT